MKTKPEIKEKLEQAEKLLKTSSETKQRWLAAVITTLRWILDTKITQEPKDPVSED